MLVAVRIRPLSKSETDDSNFNTLSVPEKDVIKITMPTEYIPDDMRGTSYILCRAHKEGAYSYAVNTVQLLQNTYYGDCIKINPASAGNNKESEIFGVGILI